MRFLWYVRASAYLLVASGFLALLITDSYGIGAGLLFALLIWAGWQVDAGRWTMRLAPVWWNLATLIALALSVADALLFRRLQITPMVNFLIFLQATKLLTPKHNRDYVTIYIISFVLLLASTIMTYSILFAVACVLFAIAVTWALITLYLKMDIEAHLLADMLANDSGAADRPADRLRKEQEAFSLPQVNNVVNGRFFAGTFAVTLLTFGLALVIFVILPRAREGIFFMYGADLSQQVSGFSEEVNLNTFGLIRMNHQPVMRVTLPPNVNPDALDKTLYWRGLAFDTYDGERWKAEPKQWKRIPVQADFDKFYWFVWQNTTEGLIPQTIELASVNLEVMFGADLMRAVEGKFLSLSYDTVTGNTHVVYDPYRLTYTVYSDLSQPSETDLRAASQEYPPDITAYYLQTPEMADRVRELAEQLGAGQPTPYDAAVAVQAYLLSNYDYSLDVPRSGDVPLLEDFLFVNPAGHCEYYATAMTILLRLQGIPARVVNGFARGRWNEYGHFFTVRQSDAHSWVEVYFPPFGWVQFDPTPEAAFGETYQQFVEQQSIIAALYRYSEYVRVRWNRYIVDYDREAQARAIMKAFYATRGTGRDLRAWTRRQRERLERLNQRVSWQDLGRMLAVIVGAAALAYGARRLLDRWRIRVPWFRRRVRRRAAPYAARFYERMRRVLARKGVSLAASATPGEFAVYVAREYTACARDVQTLTELYYAFRYGHAPVTIEHERAIAQALRAIKKQRGLLSS
jgi:protein-glutamine gamma-glutamyltransferase